MTSCSSKWSLFRGRTGADVAIRVNVKPIYLSTKVIVPYWKEKKAQGSFINMSSISEPRPRPFVVWYAASKCWANLFGS